MVETTKRLQKLAELTLDQNICRVIELGQNRFMCASYHLDKVSQIKSGRLYTVKVSENNEKITQESQSEPAYPFGILSLHLHGALSSEEGAESISQANFVSIGCSDGQLRLLSCEGDNYTIIEEIKVQAEDDAILHHGLNNCNNKAICAMQSGDINLVDLEVGEVISEGVKAHDYQAWYASFSSHAEASGDIVYSAADDAAFKKFDTRVGLATPVYSNKRHHTAGVTFVRSMDQIGCANPLTGTHNLLTGSYDCSVALWDER